MTRLRKSKRGSTDAATTQWVTSKEALGLASSTKRPTSCVMVAKIGMAKKLKEGEVEKEGLKELEEEFVGLYGEIVKTVEEMVSPPSSPLSRLPSRSVLSPLPSRHSERTKLAWN